jgi:hypothetical protein
MAAVCVEHYDAPKSPAFDHRAGLLFALPVGKIAVSCLYMMPPGMEERNRP